MKNSAVFFYGVAHDLEAVSHDMYEGKKVLSPDDLRNHIASLRQAFSRTCALMQESDTASMHQA